MMATGWYDDPSGRFEQRYYGSMGWTADVRTVDGSSQVKDPVDLTASERAQAPGQPVAVRKEIGPPAGWCPDPTDVHADAVGLRRPVAIVVASVLLILGILGHGLWARGFELTLPVGLALGVGGALLWRAVGAAMDRVMGVVLPAATALLVIIYAIGRSLVDVGGFAPVVATVLSVLCAYGLFAGTRAGWVGTIVYAAVNVVLLVGGLALTGVFVVYASDVRFIVLPVILLGGYGAVILLVTMAPSARMYVFGEAARLATLGDQPAEQPPRRTGLAPGGIAVALSMIGFVGWGFLFLAFALSFTLFGEQLTDAEQARADAALAAGVTLSALGPLGALALGRRAWRGNGHSGGARGLGLAAIVIAGIQLVAAVGVVVLLTLASI